MLVSALRRGYFLRVQTEREVRKIVFAKGADPERIEWLLNEAKRTFGYAIKSEVERTRGPYR
ncbi:hypothetical protein [Polyangium sp. 6x1]|uniref:hypothetical protein n=1 Tax=Polyangium sp. 6x1 TaxID=3042689 RepID=UPI0024830FB3|nr:hypothetical protein [Polyangium sp. 6x1]MDI1442438.1 hypothetical protein [Polyangium sp. 6x1]